jgi:Carbohydrate/starch-binding module (family 21)
MGLNLPKNPEVYLSDLFFSPKGTDLVGIVNVANLAYDKNVMARFTFDSWRSFSEIIADYSPRKNERQDEDTFTFTIQIDNQEASLGARSLFFCIHYVVKDQEFWDNNKSNNYQVELEPRRAILTPPQHFQYHSPADCADRKTVSGLPSATALRRRYNLTSQLSALQTRSPKPTGAASKRLGG